MLAIYRALLYLYPPRYRTHYGEEMLAVLSEVDGATNGNKPLVRARSCFREVTGLLNGAFHEQVRNIFGAKGNSLFSFGRFSMRSEFRFPKATVTLMCLILAGVLLTIDKAKAIQHSLPYANPQVGPIEPEQFTLLPLLLLTLAAACLGGVIAWGIVFAMRRSGVQRLSELDLTTSDSPTKLPN